MTLTQITEKGIKDGEIINADINSSAEIAVNKLANGTARQLLQTAANGTDVEFTSNVALPGTLHVASNGNIAGTLGSGDLTITSAAPFISFVDTDHNSDFNIQCNSGTFAINDTTNSATRLAINSSGTTSILNSSGNTILELKRTDTNTAGAHGTISFTASDGHSVASIGTLGDGDNEGADIVFRTTSAAASNDPFNAATPVRMTIDSTGKVGINDPNPSYQLLVNGSGTNGLFASGNATTTISLTYGASSSHILRCENSELAVGLSDASPYNLYLQARTNGNTARPISINPLGGDVAIGSNTYENIPLHVQGVSGQATIFKLKSLETTVNQQWKTSANANCLHQYDGLSFNTYTPSSSGSLELQHQINHHGITLTQGKGINFHNYGQGTDITGNQLNDYEEGYWDPAIYTGMDNGSGGASTYSVQHGRYTKIGNQVTVNYYIQFNVAFSTNAHIVLSGLPFNITTPAENSSGFGLTTYHNLSSLTVGSVILAAYGLQNVDRIGFYSGVNSVQSTNNTNHSSQYIIGGFTYFTES